MPIKEFRISADKFKKIAPNGFFNDYVTVKCYLKEHGFVVPDRVTCTKYRDEETNEIVFEYYESEYN